jgi:hypothetical protein
MGITFLLSPSFCTRMVLSALTNLHHLIRMLSAETLKVEQNRADRL